MSETRSIVRAFILTQCLPGEAPENLTDDLRLREGGVLDSMQMMKLVDALERSLGMEFSAIDINPQDFDTVDTIVAMVEARRAGC